MNLCARRLRNLSLQDKADINSLRKNNEEMQVKLKSLNKDHENLKADNESHLAQLNELRDQVGG